MYKPDIVLTKGNDIAGFIELKFSPQQHNAEKNIQAALDDIGKLDMYRDRDSDSFLLKLDPEEGSYCEPAYLRRDNTIYAFLGVARYGDRAGEVLLEKNSPESEHRANKLVLLLETKDSAVAHPKCWIKP
ncbi:MAG TPA: hypothetical protein VIO60_05910 [Rectinemataceae bacterium]